MIYDFTIIDDPKDNVIVICEGVVRPFLMVQQLQKPNRRIILCAVLLPARCGNFFNQTIHVFYIFSNEQNDTLLFCWKKKPRILIENYVEVLLDSWSSPFQSTT